MNTADHDYVRAKTRLIVGRDALKRASRIVREWQLQEQDNKQLATRFTIALLLASALGASLFFILT
jgi:hypothetical protein